MDLSNNLILDFQDFPLKLKMLEKLTLPLCKGKYFRFQLKLIYSPEITISRSIRIPLSVKIFTACKPHKEVFRSLNGDEILKGTIRTQLIYNCMEQTHIASFKILISDLNNIRIKPMIIKGISVMSKEKICKKFREINGFLNS
jgi:hypothetical protein